MNEKIEMILLTWYKGSEDTPWVVTLEDNDGKKYDITIGEKGYATAGTKLQKDLKYMDDNIYRYPMQYDMRRIREIESRRFEARVIQGRITFLESSISFFRQLRKTYKQTPFTPLMNTVEYCENAVYFESPTAENGIMSQVGYKDSEGNVIPELNQSKILDNYSEGENLFWLFAKPDKIKVNSSSNISFYIDAYSWPQGYMVPEALGNQNLLSSQITVGVELLGLRSFSEDIAKNKEDAERYHLSTKENKGAPGMKVLSHVEEEAKEYLHELINNNGIMALSLQYSTETNQITNVADNLLAVGYSTSFENLAEVRDSVTERQFEAINLNKSLLKEQYSGNQLVREKNVRAASIPLVEYYNHNFEVNKPGLNPTDWIKEVGIPEPPYIGYDTAHGISMFSAGGLSVGVAPQVEDSINSIDSNAETSNVDGETEIDQIVSESVQKSAEGGNINDTYIEGYINNDLSFIPAKDDRLENSEIYNKVYTHQLSDDEDDMGDMPYDYTHKVRIGDVLLEVPPLSINAVRQQANESVSTMRSRNAMHKGVGASRHMLTLSLYFHDLENINGHKVEAYKKNGTVYYYMDGLRTLLAQFMKSPFVPIDNDYINNDLNIHNVAMMNIEASTVEGFPEALEVTLVLEEFDTTAYLLGEDNLGMLMNYPLYRWYYQKVLQEPENKLSSQTYLPPVTELDNSFSFEIARESYLAERTAVINEFNSMKTPAEHRRKLEDEFLYDGEEMTGRAQKTLNDHYSGQTALEGYRNFENFYKNLSSEDKKKYNAGNLPVFYTANDADANEDNSSYTKEDHDMAIRAGQAIYGSKFTADSNKSVFHIDTRDTESTSRKKVKIYDVAKSLSNGDSTFIPVGAAGIASDFRITQIVKDHNLPGFFQVVVKDRTNQQNIEDNIAEANANIDNSKYSKGQLEPLYGQMSDYGIYFLPAGTVGGIDFMALIEKLSGDEHQEIEEDVEEYTKKYNEMAGFINQGEDNIPTNIYTIPDLIPLSLNVQISNNISMVHPQGTETPAFQYMGSQQPEVQLTFSTTNSGVKKVDDLFKTVARYAKQYRTGIVSNFLKIRNPLVNMFGIKAVLPHTIDVATVDGQPDQKIVTMVLSGFDMTQRKQEALYQFSSQEVTGEMNDLHLDGYDPKTDSIYIHQKMKNMELYPDLEMPFVSELEEILPQLNAGVSKFENRTEQVYLDPDFYISTNATMRKSLNELLGDSRGSEVEFKDDVGSTGSINALKNENLSVDGVDMKEASEIRDSIRSSGEGEAVESSGGEPQTISTSNSSSSSSASTTAVNTAIDAAYSLSGARYQLGAEGPNAIDCSGLVWYAYGKAGLSIKKNSTTNWWNSPDAHGLVRIEQAQAQRGDLVFFDTGWTNRYPNHVGIITNASTKEFVHIYGAPSVTTDKWGTQGWDKGLRFMRVQGIEGGIGSPSESSGGSTYQTRRSGDDYIDPYFVWRGREDTEAASSEEDGSGEDGLDGLAAKINLPSTDGKIRRPNSSYKIKDTTGGKNPSEKEVWKYVERQIKTIFGKLPEFVDDEFQVNKSLTAGVISTFVTGAGGTSTNTDQLRLSSPMDYYLLNYKRSGSWSTARQPKHLKNGLSSQVEEHGKEFLGDDVEDGFTLSGSLDELAYSIGGMTKHTATDGTLTSIPKLYKTRLFLYVKSILDTESGWRQFDEKGAPIKQGDHKVGIMGAPFRLANSQSHVDNISKDWQANIRFSLSNMKDTYVRARNHPYADYNLRALDWAVIAHSGRELPSGLYNPSKANNELYTDQDLAIAPESINYFKNFAGHFHRTTNSIKQGNPVAAFTTPSGIQRDLMAEHYDIEKEEATEMIEEIAEIESNNFDQYTLEDKIRHMYVDMEQFDQTGRMIRAFPSYSLLFIDEGKWFWNFRTWDNFYGYNALHSIDLYRSRKVAADTLVVKMSNMYSNLSTSPTTQTNPNLRLPSFFSSQFWEHYVLGMPTEGALESRAEIYDQVMLQAGARVHLRMGYGADARHLPVVFNGSVAEMDTDEVMEIVAQSDALELQNVISGDTEDDNVGIFNRVQEPRKTIGELMTSKGNWLKDMINTATDATLFKTSPMGIAHFGSTVHSESGNRSILPGAHSEDFGESLQNVYSQNGMETRSQWHNTDGTEMPIMSKTSEKVKSLITNISVLLGDTAAFDEANIAVSYYGRTVWEIIQTFALCSQDYIATTMPFEFRSTLFFGKPHWMVQYKYDSQYVIDAARNKIDRTVTKAHNKTFMQAHVYNSNTNIISNNIMASEQGIYNNVIVTYDGRQAGPVQADSDIRYDKQRTIDVEANILAPRAFEYYRSEDQALIYGQSTVRDFMKDMYKGEYAVIGDATVKPYDVCYMNDAVNDMNGVHLVKAVHHTLSAETGFVTFIEPDAFVYNFDEELGAIATNVSSISKNLNMNSTAKSFIGGAASLMGGAIATKLIKLFGSEVGAYASNRFSNSMMGSISKGVARHVASAYYTAVSTWVNTGSTTVDIAKQIKTAKTYSEFRKYVNAANTGMWKDIATASTRNVAESAGIFKKGSQAILEFAQKGRTSARLAKISTTTKNAASFMKGLLKSSNFLTVILSIGIEIGVGYLTEWWNRKKQNAQAIIVVPLVYKGRRWTALMNWHKGSVYGDDPSMQDRFMNNTFGSGDEEANKIFGSTLVKILNLIS